MRIMQDRARLYALAWLAMPVVIGLLLAQGPAFAAYGVVASAVMVVLLCGLALIS